MRKIRGASLAACGSTSPNNSRPMDDNFGDYRIRQLWSALSERQRRAITKLAKRALRLDRTAAHAYEIGRLDDAELLDEEAARTLETLEAALLEIESESGDLRVDDESDMMRELAHLYERYMRGSSPGRLDEIDADDYLSTARWLIRDAGGNADRASDAQLLEAGRDAYERLRALGRGRQQRDVRTSDRGATRRARQRAWRRR